MAERRRERRDADLGGRKERRAGAYHPLKGADMEAGLAALKLWLRSLLDFGFAALRNIVSKMRNMREARAALAVLQYFRNGTNRERG